MYKKLHSFSSEVSSLFLCLSARACVCVRAPLCVCVCACVEKQCVVISRRNGIDEAISKFEGSCLIPTKSLCRRLVILTVTCHNAIQKNGRRDFPSEEDSPVTGNVKVFFEESCERGSNRIFHR